MYGAKFLACGRIDIFGYIVVGKLYAQGVVVQVVVDGVMSRVPSIVSEPLAL